MTSAKRPDGTPTAFAYRAVRADGSTVAGIVDASSRDAALAALAGQGQFILELRPHAGGVSRLRAMPPTDLAVGLRALTTLLTARLPIARTLNAFESIAPPSWRAALPPLREAVREGKSFATALRATSLAFPPVILGIVQAGEAAGDLEGAVRRAAELAEGTAATQHAIRNALAYPVVLGIAGAGSLALLVGVVLPRFATILADLGQELPPTTAFVIGAARGVTAATPVALLIALAGGLAWYAWSTSPQGRQRWHRLLLHLPVLGSLRHSAATARVAAALAALLDAGVPVAAAFRHAAQAADDAELERRLVAAREHLLAGASVARALDATGGLTGTAVRLVRAGEETGRLGAMLSHAAQVEQEVVARLVRTAVRMLEPMLILGFGGIIAFVAAALLQAVYSLRPVG